MAEKATRAAPRPKGSDATDVSSSRQVVELLPSKLTAPRLRPKTVSRPGLLERLHDADGEPIVTIVAPAGYGKTTLLAEWAQHDGQAFAWVSLDEQDNDPKVLLTYVAASLEGIEPIDPGVFDALASPQSSVTGVVAPRLGKAFASISRPFVLVLDDVHLLHSREGQAAVAVLVDNVPEGSRIAIAARREPPLRLARLRAQGRVLEVGPRDLSLDREQSADLLRSAGVELPDADLTRLHEKTEGWPVGLYLAALALRAGGSVSKAVAAFGGDDLFVSEYLHFEVLSRLPEEQIQFLKRSAVLDAMSGQLCDAVLQETGSDEMLARLQRSNNLLIPLDRHGEWYRYHHLFRDLLVTELERSEPGSRAALLRRAAGWYEQNGKPEEALEYSISAGDKDAVARLIGMLALPMYRQGRISTLLRWCAWLQDRGRADEYPLVAVIASWLFALTGLSAEADWWADAADLEQIDAASSEEASLAYALGILLRAALCRRGVEVMRDDSEEAVRTLGRSFATPYLFLGISSLLMGDLQRADQALGDAVEVGVALGQTVDAVIALGERALIAISSGEWDRADRFAEQGRSIVRAAHLEEYSTSAIVYAVSARVALHGGDGHVARQHLIDAQRLRGQLTYSLPYLAVQTRLELARAYVGVDEIAGARTLLREIGELLQRRPHLGALVEETDELRSQLAAHGSATGGFQTLTTAEIRLLPLLTTHFTFREIGEELYVSPNTVKSQAMSIYRKLGASSRSEAIRNARKIGLLEG